MGESWSKRGPRLALWDEAFTQDGEGRSDLQRSLDKVIAEVAGEHDLVISRKVHDRKDEFGVPVEYHIQPLGLEIWLYSDRLDLLHGEWNVERRLEPPDLTDCWNTPSDFIADFRQALDSLLTDGDLEFKHTRDVSFGEEVGDAVLTLGFLALIILLWFSSCAAVEHLTRAWS